MDVFVLDVYVELIYCYVFLLWYLISFDSWGGEIVDIEKSIYFVFILEIKLIGKDMG